MRQSAVKNLQLRLKIPYDNLKIRHKLFLLLSLGVFVLGSIGLIGIQITLSLYDGLLYNESAKVLNLSTVNIEHELKQVEEFSYTVLSHPNVQSYLKKLQLSRTAAEHSRIGSALTELLWVYVFERNIISVNMVDNYGFQYSGGPGIPNEIIEPIIAKAEAKHGSVFFIHPVSGTPDLLCARQIREIKNLSLKPLGTLIIRINMDALVRQSTAGMIDRTGSLFIFSGRKPIYTSGPLAEKLSKTLILNTDNGYQVIKIDGRNYFLTHTYSSENGWLYVNVLPYDMIFKPIIIMRSVIIIILALFLMGTVFISMQAAQNLTKPIENLSLQMKRVEKGDFTIDDRDLPGTARADEIGDLQRDFSIMIQKINTLIQEDYTKQIMIKDTQFRALQAQINPHFLYNTMESINWLAKLNGEQEISRMVEALGNLLRSAIDNKEPVTTLGKDLDLLRDYISIQQMRFGERLNFTMDIDPKWHRLHIPKLTLQPIVENSIRYGLETMTGNCRIELTANEGSDVLEIIISDNGPGMNPDFKEACSHGTGIGLKNIDDRLRLIFGETYGLRVSSQSGRGTSVSIRIPKQEENDG